LQSRNLKQAVIQKFPHKFHHQNDKWIIKKKTLFDSQ